MNEVALFAFTPFLFLALGLAVFWLSGRRDKKVRPVASTPPSADLAGDIARLIERQESLARAITQRLEHSSDLTKRALEQAGARHRR
jgi:hypothetical protein